jgi:hypothetical protein
MTDKYQYIKAGAWRAHQNGVRESHTVRRAAASIAFWMLAVGAASCFVAIVVLAIVVR